MVIISCSSDKLSFWIDNIHCYASQKQQAGQNIQDTQDDGLNPPIVVVCTGDEPEKDRVSETLIIILTS